MNDRSLDFLRRLLATPGPSGDEAAAGRLWREYAGSFADRVWADVRGSSFAALDNGAPRVLLAGHIDEIGIMITYIDDEGYLSFAGVGGWDTQVLVGQRIRPARATATQGRTFARVADVVQRRAPLVVALTAGLLVLAAVPFASAPISISRCSASTLSRAEVSRARLAVSAMAASAAFSFTRLQSRHCRSKA